MVRKRTEKLPVMPVEIRSEKELLAAEEEMFERLWYYRERECLLRGKLTKDQLKYANKKMAEIEKKYDKEDLRCPCNSCQSRLEGKLETLRWVLGGEWDELDT